MASTPSSASGSGSSAQERTDLEAGLTALKQQNYQQAIVLLESLVEKASSPSVQLRAKIGLVMAHEKIGNPAKALDLCNSLTQASSPKIQNWAVQTLTRLQNASSSPSIPVQNPSTSSNPPSASNFPNPAQSSPTQPIETGFVPFDVTSSGTKPSTQPPTPPQQSTSAIPETGFVPFDAVQPTESQQKPDQSYVPNIQLPLETPSSQTASENFPVELPESQPMSEGLPDETSETIARDAAIQAPEPTEEVEPLTHDLTQPIAPPETQWQWQQAGRAESWRRLRRLKSTQFRIEQLLTALALFWLVPRVIHFGMDLINDLLYRLPVVQPIQLLYRDPTGAVWIGMAILFVFSPWLLDGVLRVCYGMQPLPMTTLFQRSQEANRILHQYCQARNWQVPALRILPTNAPMALTYGCWPRFARIVVSQGLLDQLEPDEIAVIYGREIAHIGQWNVLIMTFVTVVLQVPYLLYSQLHRLPEQLIKHSPSWVPNSLQNGLQRLLWVLKPLTWIISPMSYACYWLLRWPALWISQRRVYYSDRIACNLTGNPNGLIRALLKISVGVSREIEIQGKTPEVLEGLGLLTPVSYQSTLPLRRLVPNFTLEPGLEWDLKNPYRKWLTLNQPHPLTGERLQLLCFYAKFWELEPELFLTLPETKSSKTAKRWKKAEWSRLFEQGAPFFGVIAGLLLGGLLWLLGGIFSLLGIWQLEWLLGDRSLLLGSIPICVGLGIFLRINRFFPDIKPRNQLKNPDLSQLVQNPDPIPLDSQAVYLEGTLLGRTGVENFWEQDLLLQTSTGLIPLHHIPQWTPLSYFWPQLQRPSHLVGQAVNVVGWWRRGAQPWIDLELIQSRDQKTTILAGHPIWSTVLGLVIVCWGVYVIISGSG